MPTMQIRYHTKKAQAKFLKYDRPLDESWKLTKWYVKIGRYACYSDTLWNALYGLMAMYVTDFKPSRK